MHAQLADEGVRLASAQVQISLLSWGKTQQNLIDTCAELGVTVIAYSPLALGLLTGKYDEDNLPNNARARLFKGLLPQIQPLLAEMQAVAASRGKSMSQVGRHFVHVYLTADLQTSHATFTLQAEHGFVTTSTSLAIHLE